MELYKSLRTKIVKFWPRAPRLVEISAGPNLQAHSLSEADFEEMEEHLEEEKVGLIGGKTEGEREQVAERCPKDGADSDKSDNFSESERKAKSTECAEINKQVKQAYRSMKDYKEKMDDQMGRMRETQRKKAKLRHREKVLMKQVSRYVCVEGSSAFL